uniref:Uncharacterized protein n=1 Tax=Lepeophtheirus salmonis TaxID=72036 RepID=A0A0K2VFH1_LEPSM
MNMNDIKVANAINVANFVVQIIQLALGLDFDENKLKVFITDGVSYCKKSGQGLKRSYPHLKTYYLCSS